MLKFKRNKTKTKTKTKTKSASLGGDALFKRKKRYGVEPEVKQNARALTQAHAFRTMLDSSLRGEFDISETVQKWWCTAFKTKLPSGTVNELSAAIKYRLLVDGYEKENMVVPATIKTNLTKALKRLSI